MVVADSLFQIQECLKSTSRYGSLKGLEHKCDGKWLRELGLFSVEKRLR